MLIHRIWLGDNMPANYREFGELWQELNPEYQVHDWTEEEIFDTKWHNQEVIDQMIKESKMRGADKIAFYTHVADVVDYELLFEYGGWYFNADIKPLKPLSVLFERFPIENKCALAMEDDMHAVNMAMWAPTAGQQLFETIIDLLPRRYFGTPGAFMNFSTGTGLIGEVLSRRSFSTVLFPRQVFNPIHFTDFGYGEEPNIDIAYPEETVATHMWGHRTNQRNQRILES